MTANNQGILIIRDSEWGPYYVIGKLGGYEVYIKFGVKEWRDGVVNLVIGDWEMPFREMPKWLEYAMLRIGPATHTHFNVDYVLRFVYLSPVDIMALVLGAPRCVREFAEEAIEDVRRRALQEVKKAG